ncbi:hypothetical protein KIL84_000947 [Mauremys mutica]|uniref:Uncharacterized protein n=1 Tax=Mauremys mutica TaxID=74926 RepID=A0A9D4ANV9_9SAUR|nr:hypothetical protein KIL84_000947 [Mauremys mutica]
MKSQCTGPALCSVCGGKVPLWPQGAGKARACLSLSPMTAGEQGLFTAFPSAPAQREEMEGGEGMLSMSLTPRQQKDRVQRLLPLRKLLGQSRHEQTRPCFRARRRKDQLPRLGLAERRSCCGSSASRTPGSESDCHGAQEAAESTSVKVIACVHGT